MYDFHLQLKHADNPETYQVAKLGLWHLIQLSGSIGMAANIAYQQQLVNTLINYAVLGSQSEVYTQ